MDASQFQIRLNELKADIDQAIDHDLPIVIGIVARDFFHEAFQEGIEGFTDRYTTPWQEVKRRINPKEKDAARANRAILTGDSADLGRSITYDPGVAQVTIRSDLPYSDAHNSGTTTAGRSGNVTIPARPFIQDSELLDELVKDEILRKIGDIFK